MTRFTTNILICSTKTPQLSYMLHSSPPEVKSLFYPGLWHLSWRPWWWETTVNRLSFFLKLLLYKIIIDLEKNPCWALLCLGTIGKRKKKKNRVQQQLLEKPWPPLKCNFTSSSTSNDHLFCCNNGCPLLYPFGRPVWNNQVARKVTKRWHIIQRSRAAWKLLVATVQLGRSIPTNNGLWPGTVHKKRLFHRHRYIKQNTQHCSPIVFKNEQHKIKSVYLCKFVNPPHV